MKKLLIVILLIIGVFNLDGCTKKAVKLTLVSFGGNHSAAITTTGRIFTWGLNSRGQLGSGTETNNSTPIDITKQIKLNSGETIDYISLGFGQSAVITSTGRAFTWGFNGYGQLGDGAKMDRNIPYDITNQFELQTGEILKTIIIEDHAAALTSYNRLFTWGYNFYGQLGLGNTIDQSKPTDITSYFNLEINEKIIQVSLGGHHTAVLTSTGRVFTFGANNSGALGNGTQINQILPIDITNQFSLVSEETISQIHLGSGNGAALTSLGRIFTWGYNSDGQLGDGSRISKLRPVDITPQFELEDGETIEQLSLGDSHAGALTSLGRVFRWGDKLFGQSGDDTKTDDFVPIDITSQFKLYKDEKMMYIELGSFHSAALTSSNRLFTWGSNNYGQLGNGKNSTNGSVTDITRWF